MFSRLAPAIAFVVALMFASACPSMAGPQMDTVEAMSALGFGMSGVRICPGQETVLEDEEGGLEESPSGGSEPLGDWCPDSVTVMPRTLDSCARSWTFMVGGPSDVSPDSVGLTIDSGTLSPILVTKTSARTFLATFSGGSSSSGTARLDLGAHLSVPVAVECREQSDPDSYDPEWMVFVIRRGVITYPTGQSSAAMQEISIGDPWIRYVLQGFGLRRLRKALYDRGEDAPVREGKNGPFTPFDKVYRTYEAQLPIGHSVQAAVKALGQIDAFEYVAPQYKATFDNDPCDAWIFDPE